MVGAEKFGKTFDDIIKEVAYLPEQIFNVNETGLCWKSMLARTYTHKEANKYPGD